MMINVGIREEDNAKILFVTDDKGFNFAELEISDKFYEACLKEFTIKGE